ncbi:hypothetical protein ACQPYK_36280 [Streptosporangium sp. CA-135522]|uniref:hypothetical protein n=1 Tax=Streptosporangium sp. CA-135522 TaxID=3240072 RepID=UPI003D8A7EB6
MLGKKWFIVYASPPRIEETSSRIQRDAVVGALGQLGHPCEVIPAKRRDAAAVRKALREQQRRMNSKNT